MSTITPASAADITEFYKAASAHLSSMGISPEYHEHLLNNELAAQYGDLTKAALGTIGEAAPQLNKVKPQELTHIPSAGGGGKAGLLKKVLLGLGIAGTGGAIGTALAKKDDKKKDKEAMDKTVEGGVATAPAKTMSPKNTKVLAKKPQAAPKCAEAAEPVANKVAESIAAMALFKAAKDHMVNNLNIPEKQAQEILKNHFGVK